MLTQRQHQLLRYIFDYQNEHGVPPSFEEMRDALRLKSKSGIHRLITGLEERGYLRRLAYRARALEIVRLPPGFQRERDFADFAEFGEEDDSNVVHADFGAQPSAIDPPRESRMLPLYGRIAAGTPIESLRDPSSFIEVPPHLLKMGDHYALEVVGDSMIEAGIQDGDVVVVQRAETAENGEIVVALIDGNEVTLKRFRRKGKAIALEAANAAYETRIFGDNRVRVQGRLVGLLRRY